MPFGINFGPFTVMGNGKAKYAKKMYKQQQQSAMMENWAERAAERFERDFVEALNALQPVDRDTVIAKIAQYEQVSPQLADQEKHRVLDHYRQQRQQQTAREAAERQWQRGQYVLQLQHAALHARRVGEATGVPAELVMARYKRDLAVADMVGASAGDAHGRRQTKVNKLNTMVSGLERKYGVAPDNPAAVSDRR